MKDLNSTNTDLDDAATKWIGLFRVDTFYFQQQDTGQISSISAFRVEGEQPGKVAGFRLSLEIPVRE